jgi:hypothetical protein
MPKCRRNVTTYNFVPTGLRFRYVWIRVFHHETTVCLLIQYQVVTTSSRGTKSNLRPISPSSFNQPEYRVLMPQECASCVPRLRAKEEIPMARKVGQIITRGDHRWLIRVYLGRDHETKKRHYHNRTIQVPCGKRVIFDEEVARTRSWSRFGRSKDHTQ